MKKLLAFLVALTMLIGLTGCSGFNEVEETEETSIDIEDAIIDTWVCEFQARENDYVNEIGDDLTLSIDFYRGGTGNICYHNVTQDHDNYSLTLTWEIVDSNIINIYVRGVHGDVPYGLEYDENDDTISYVDGSHTLSRAR